MIRTLTIDQQYLGQNLADCNLIQTFKEGGRNKKNLVIADFDEDSKQIQFKPIEDDQMLDSHN